MATLKEVSQVLLKLAAAIPHAPPLTEENYRMYHAYLGDVDSTLLELAADMLIIKTEFFPSIGKVRSAVVDLLVKAEGVPDAGEAWGEVARSFSTHGLYRGSPEWSHPLIGKAVEAIGGYARLCGSTNATADRSQFRHAYTSLLKKHREKLRTPLSMQHRFQELESGGLDVHLAATDEGRRYFERETEVESVTHIPLALAPPETTQRSRD